MKHMVKYRRPKYYFLCLSVIRISQNWFHKNMKQAFALVLVQNSTACSKTAGFCSRKAEIIIVEPSQPILHGITGTLYGEFSKYENCSFRFCRTCIWTCWNIWAVCNNARLRMCSGLHLVHHMKRVFGTHTHPPKIWVLLSSATYTRLYRFRLPFKNFIKIRL